MSGAPADVHAGQPVLQAGAELAASHTNEAGAAAAVILLHGRGATAQSMSSFAEALNPGGLTFLLPQAAHNRWYPNSAFAPLESNAPDLPSALAMIEHLVSDLVVRGYPHERIFFGGFSQGACLAAEYVARNARRYGGLFVLSGALIGPPGASRDYPGSFAGMPVFIASSDVDPWVAHPLVAATAQVFERMGAQVDFRTYNGMGHTVNEDEIAAVHNLLAMSMNSGG